MQNGTDDMTKRMTISVDDDVYEILEKWADDEVRTVANLAAALVTMAARERQPPKKQSGSTSKSK